MLLPQDHIDTDQIIPARFLKATSRDGFGKNLFSSWRYLPDGTPNPEFVLNTEYGSGAFLLVGENFGCGSSREHAAWALYDYGFRVIIARSFADIFKGNALNNGIVPVELGAADHEALVLHFQNNQSEELLLNLNTQEICSTGLMAFSYPFAINPFRKECLMAGTDLIDYLIARRPQIAEYEKTRN